MQVSANVSGIVLVRHKDLLPGIELPFILHKSNTMNESAVRNVPTGQNCATGASLIRVDRPLQSRLADV